MAPPSGWVKVSGNIYKGPDGTLESHPEWEGTATGNAGNYSDTFASLPGVTHINTNDGGPGQWVIQDATGGVRPLTQADIEALSNPVRRTSTSSSNVSSVSAETLAAQAATM